MRDELLGSIHFSFKKSPPEIDKLPGILEELSAQITIAIDNMLSYDKLEAINKRLWKEKESLFERFDLENPEFYCTSPAMTKLIKDVELIADTNTSVLISGETGTRKDHIAGHIHNRSSRRDLCYRLNTVHIWIPPLRERADDVIIQFSAWTLAVLYISAPGPAFMLSYRQGAWEGMRMI